MSRKKRYSALGFSLGIGAPVTWLMIKILFFPVANQLFVSQLLLELTSSAANICLYIFMGLGTSMVMGSLGFFIGKSADELSERALELDLLHQEVNAQKELFENRYKARTIFTQINSLPDSLKTKFFDAKRLQQAKLDGGCE